MRLLKPTRRHVLSTGVFGAASLALPAAAMVRPNPPGIKIGVPAPWNPTPDDLRFFKQLGFDYVYAAAPGMPSVDDLLARKKLWADVGITLHNIRWFSGGPSGGSKHMENILLGNEGRDAGIEQCKQFVSNYGKAGFGYTICTISVTGVWSSTWAREDTAGAPMTRGAATREFNEADPNLRATGGPRDAKPGKDTLIFGRAYGEDEILANYRYFLKQITPVAEENGVLIGFHPDDPPAFKSLGGVARINGTFKDIQRNLEIANSPNIGMTFCLGVWLEGGDRMGMDPVSAIKKYIAQKKVFSINFRNVSSPMPHFFESWMDNGYYDMYPFMKALIESNYDGFLEQDHTLPIVGAPNTYDAFAAGYERALYQRAMRETGKMR